MANNIDKVIQDAAKQMLNIRARRRELNAEAGEIRKTLKDAGVQTRAFDFSVRLMEMEQEGRDEYIDNLRQNFAALGIGEQGALFPEAAPASEQVA